tara:strand:+ start:1814 stop:2494 length:681 start_codon:yes stop_codon:yes gene_type:complete
MKKIFFLAGLPRSGKNLLGTILNQNSNMFGLLQSPLCELLHRQKNWESKDDDVQEIKNIKSKYLKNFIKNFYKEFTNKDIIFDSKRNWDDYNNIQMYRNIFNSKPKVVCCVRNVEDIIASSVKLYDQSERFWDFEPMKIKFYQDYWNLRRTYLSKYKDCLLLIDYDKLISDPEDNLKKIYKFINEPYFKHNFNNIKKSKTNVKELLSTIQIKHFSKLSFWKGYSFR